jgi:hypothetical protein
MKRDEIRKTYLAPISVSKQMPRVSLNLRTATEVFRCTLACMTAAETIIAHPEALPTLCKIRFDGKIEGSYWPPV